MRTNVLVLEDNPGLAATLAGALRAAGCDCRTVARVARAVQEIECAVPHLLLSDYHVADGTAADLLARMRDRGWEHVPVLLATAAPAIARQAADPYPQVKAILQKPVAIRELVETVGRLADRTIRPAAPVRLVGPEERRRLLQFPLDEEPAVPVQLPGAIVA